MRPHFSIKCLLGALLVCINVFVSAQQATILKVACIGNSVTFGAGHKKPQLTSYPSVLQQLMGQRYTVKNFGHSGATLLRKGHNPYYKTKAFAEALAFAPDIAIVHLGLNDTDPRNWPDYRDNFEPDYAWLIDTLRKVNPVIQVFVCRLTPIFNGHSRFKSGTRDWYWQIQELIPAIAKANHTALIDLYTPLHNRPDLFADNLHPDAEGASIIAHTVYKALTGDVGGLQIPSIFTDDMVLQREQPIYFYGKANAGTLVEVTFHMDKQKTVADEYGNWKIAFPAMQAGGPYEASIKNQQSVITLKNVLIGEVWLCSGQSNMAFQLQHAIGGKEAIQEASRLSRLRLFKYNQLAETNAAAWDSLTLDKINKLQYFSGHWKITDSQSAADFSAIAYFFGKKLTTEENIPIGLIQVAVGGSPIESWIDRYTMEHDEQLVDILDNWRKSDFIQAFCRERADVNLKNAIKANQRHPYEPCYNYEAGIDSLTRFPIKGVLWYQGESNTHNPEAYQALFKTMVRSWRKKWGYDFPFYFVQLSSIDRPSWPHFREIQRKLQKEVPNVYMAVSSDLGDSLDVHPTRKREVGERLALLAERYTYNKNIPAEGPMVTSAKQDSKSVIIDFSFAKKLSASNNEQLTGFELVTTKGLLIPAQANIVSGNKVKISLPANEKIKAVAYAWQPFTRANLVNEAGLPASTFYLTLNKQYNEL
ncbi:GDSL-type esterase/lipase family protein [Chitinophagaceae bacterium LB-8]|uniref:GDSL-type esterase/lipase family protein n=1 Tax=Paraflavisolibacter caeni TaxID=2982496 RepID=A0A9X3B906_9BACT|nr:GDSL-type esterase/lipase family protein [Paraflavisolibacter caeni]MCU7550461.1 GDSL-type esterase/lipase family protein [Paraflavisolibacter caeni]